MLRRYPVTVPVTLSIALRQTPRMRPLVALRAGALGPLVPDRALAGQRMASSSATTTWIDRAGSARRSLVPNPIVVSLLPNRPCTLVFTLRDPDDTISSSSGSSHNRPAQLKVLLPMDDPTVSAIDLVSALRSEVAGDLKVTRGLSDHVLADAKLDQMTVWQFLHSNAVCWIRGVAYSVDPADLLTSVQQMRAALAGMERTAQAGSDKLARIDARVRKQLDLAVHGGTAFLWAELATIIYLTNELGWDLMEPTSYLLGLTTLTLGSAFYALLGREFTYENMTASLESWLTRRLLAKEGIDFQQTQEIILAADKTRQQMLPILASAASLDRPHSVSK